MSIELRHRIYLIILCLLIRIRIVESQTGNICPTAYWNSTFSVIAGITGVQSNTATTLYGPNDLYITANNTLYVADYYNSRVQKFVGRSPTATTLTNISASYVASVQVDSNGVVYVLDVQNYRVLKWNNGVVSIAVGGRGSGSTVDKISTSYYIQLDSNANIYVSDYANNRVSFWTAGNANTSTIVAGGYGAGSASHQLNGPYGLYLDSAGTLYICDSNNNRIQRWTSGAIVGDTVVGQSGVAGPWSYQLNYPTHITADQFGYLYILDTNNKRVQKWYPGARYGITVAQSSTWNTPRGLRFDLNGNMLVSDQLNYRVLLFAMVCGPNVTTTTPPTPQTVTPICPTAAWNQSLTVRAGSTGNLGSTPTTLYYPHNIFVDIYGNLYVADCNNQRIQKYAPGSMFATTVAGITLDNGGSLSELYSPTAVRLDASHAMYIMDWTNCRVMKWFEGDPLGTVVAGGNGCGGSLTQIYNAYGLFLDNQSNIYISDYQLHRVVKWYSGNTTAGVLIAGGNGQGSTADRLSNPWGIYVDNNQGLYVVDRSNQRVQYWPYGAVIGTTVAGTTGSAGSWSYQFNGPTSITFDPYGYMYVLDTNNNRVQKWFPGAAYGTTVLSASMNSPYGMTFDNGGNIVIADTYNHRVITFGLTCPPTTTTTTAPPTTPQATLCPTATWNSTLIARAGLLNNQGTAPTLLNYPYNMYVDGYNNIYVADTSNHRIQLFSSGSFVGTTVAGASASPGSGLSTLNSPSAIYVDQYRNMYILDTSNYRVLRWKLGDPLGYVIVGTGSWGASLTQISTSYAMFVDSQLNIYISDSGNCRVTKWLPTNTTSGILVAGNNGQGSTAEKLNNPWGIYVDSNQAVFICDRNNHRIQRWDYGALVGVTVAGTTGVAGVWSYLLNNPTAILFDAVGFMYILDSGNARIQKWWPGASYGYTLLSASFATPVGMQYDRANSILVADTNNHRIVSFGYLCAPSTTTSTLPPTLTTSQICATAVWNQAFLVKAGSTGNAGSTNSLLNSPTNIAFDGYQYMYVADTSNHRIQQFAPGSTIGVMIAGSGSAGSLLASLNNPSDIYIDSNRNMFILDTTNYRVLRWKVGDPMGTVVAGGNSWGSSLTQITTSYAMFVDGQQNVYVSEYGNHRITLWLSTNTSVGVVVAGGNGQGSTSSQLNYPWGVYVTVNGTLFIADRNNHRIQRFDSSLFGVTVAGSSTDPGPYAYQLNGPTGITFDPFGYLYILDTGNNRVQRWLPGASYGITVIAAASMSSPQGLRVDYLGNFFISDSNNHRILSFALSCPSTTTTTTPPPTLPTVQVCPTAIWNQSFVTLAGSLSNPGSTSTLINNPGDISFDGYRNMYVVDMNNHRIQQFPPGSNVGTTVAGVTGTAGARRAELNTPYAMQVTSNQTMFIMDTYNYRVLQWQVGDPIGYIVAGGKGSGSTYDRMGLAYALLIDNQNNIYISDSANNRITLWRVTNMSYSILVAGGNGQGNTPDKLNSPWGIYLDSSQGLYIVDRGNHRVQYWPSGAALGTTVAGSTSDPGPWSYQFNSPTTITFDPYGFMYVLDYNNDRVQKWMPGANFGITVAATNLGNPLSMRFDRTGNIIIADTSNDRILSFAMMCPPTTTTTVSPPTQPTIPLCPTAVWNQSFVNLAGALSTSGSTANLLNYPNGVDFDPYGNMYVVDQLNHRIQRFSPGANLGATVAGFNLASGTSRSELANPQAIVVTPNETMFILDRDNYRLLKWQLGDTLGYVVAGGRGQGAAFTQIGISYGLFLDSNYNFYISEYGNQRVTIWYSGNTTAGRLVAGGNGVGSTPDKLNGPWGVYVDVNGTLFIVDRGNHRVQRWNVGASTGVTVAGSTSNPGPWSYQFNNPSTITFDQYGYMYVLDTNNNRVQKWLPGSSYGTTAIASSLNSPIGMTIDHLGNMVIADTSNHRVVSFSVYCPSTTTTTTAPPIPTTISMCATATWNQSYTIVAGATSNAGSTSTLLNNPYFVAFDGYRDMYVVDTSNHRIQKYPQGSATATTVAGFNLASGSSRSELYNPVAIAVTSNRTMFILDRDNYRVLKWQVGDPLGYVVAGGQGQGAAFTQIGVSYGLFLDSNYNMYISEYGNNRITFWASGNTTAGRLAAGGNGAGNTPDKLNGPWGVYVDNSNAMFIVDRTNHRVQRWASGAASASTVAGSTSDPGPWSYQFNSPTAIVLDIFGYIYVLDYGNYRVQKWLPGAAYGTTVAAASMGNTYGLAFDPLNNLYIADTTSHRVLRFNVYCPPTTTTTVAPPTQPLVSLCPTAVWNSSFSLAAGATGNAGSTSTLLNSPYDVTFDVYNYMYVADYSNNRIQKFAPNTFTGITVAGFNLASGSSRSELYNTPCVRVLGTGKMFIMDDYNHRVLKWQAGDPLGYIVAGGNGLGSAFNQLGYTASIFVDQQENIYVSENSNHRVVLWTAGNTTAGRLAAAGNGAGNTPDKLNTPWGIYVDVNGTMYIVDRGNHRVQKWTAGAASGTTVAGSTSDPGPWSYQLNTPNGITLDQYGYLYIVDNANARIQKWWPGGSYGITVAAVSMNYPNGINFDRLGNLYVADTNNHRILKFSLMCPQTTTTTPAPPTLPRIPLCATATWNSTYVTVAGAVSNAGSTSTLLNNPYDVTFDSYGYMYVADYNNNRIQRYPPGSNVGTTVAGFTLGSGPSRSELYNPAAIYVDANLNMYIVDSYNYRVLQWQVGQPLGYVIAGGRGTGSTYDKLARCYGFFVDSQSNVYVSDNGNNRITLWYSGNTTAGLLVAGGNGVGNTLDKLNGPWGVYVDSSNSMYIVDRNNHRVQKWAWAAAVGVTVAGSTSDSGPWSYQFNNPTAISMDPQGYIYVLDYGNDRVQKWLPGAPYGRTVVSTNLINPIGMQFDLSGNLLITDTGANRVISFSVYCAPTTTTTVAPPTQPILTLCPSAAWNGTFSTVAGSMSTSGATANLVYNPNDVTFDAYNNMYVADTSNHRIQFYPQGSSVGTTVAGNSGASGTSRSELYNPYAIRVTANQTMFILDMSNYRVLRWQLGETLGYVVCGGRGSGTTFDKMGITYGMFVDNQNNVYLGETSNNRVTKWVANNNTASMLVAGGNGAGSTSDKLNGPWGVYVDSTNAVYVVDRSNHRVQKWPAGASQGVTVAGSTSDPGPWAYQFNNPTALTMDQYGWLYVLDTGNNRIQRWTPGATFGKTVVSASMNSPSGMTFDRLGNLYIADTSNYRVLSFALTCPPAATPAPISSTIAPTQLCPTAIWNPSFTQIAGGTAFSGSNQYLFNSPYDIYVDVYGYIYVADYNNNRIQQFPPGSNAGNTVAGFTIGSGTSRSELYNPAGIYVDPSGAMYIVDSYNYRVFRWQLGDPMGYVIAGGKGVGSTYDKLDRCYGLFVDALYNVFISDYGNNRVTKWLSGNTTAGQLVAGGNGAGATADKLNGPWGIYVDNSYSLFVADRLNHRVQRWPYSSATGITVAGNTGDSGPWSYQLNNPTDVTMDPYGYIFIMDSGNARIQKWWPGGTYGVTVLAASMNGPLSMHIDPSGKLYVADTGNQRILSFALSCPPTTTSSPLPPTITTATLCPTAAFNQNASLVTGSISGSGTSATFVNSPSEVAFDSAGYMYVVDTGNHRIQQYPPGSNAGVTVAGTTAVSGTSRAQLNSPSAIHVNSAGDMFILDTNNYRVLQWSLGDTFGTVVVNGRGSGTTLDKIGVSYSMFVDNQNNVYVSDTNNHRVTKWLAGNNTIGQLVAGIGILGSSSTQLNFPRGVYVDSSNVLYVVDRSNHRVQRWPAGSAVGTTIAGQSTVAGTWSYQFNSPTDIMFDQYSAMYILDTGNNRIQKWPAGSTYGITIVQATMSTPLGMSFDPSGNIIVADTSYQRIISFVLSCPPPVTYTAQPPTLPPNSACQTGIYNSSSIAVAGMTGASGTGQANLNTPMDVFVDGNQNIFVADYVNSRIQKFPPAGSTIGSPLATTVAGFTLAGGTGYSELDDPSAVFVHPNGTVYIADSANYRVQRWAPNEPLGSTVAGGRGVGTTLDKLGLVNGIYVDDPGNIYVSESGNHRVTFWTAGNSTIGRLIAGTGASGNALNQLNGPYGIHVDNNGTLYVADRGNNRIVKWTAGATSGILLAGSATGSSGATPTLLNSPTSVALDPLGFLYVMDAGNNRVQRFPPGSTTGETIAAASLSSPKGMRIDSIGNIYIADSGNHRILEFRCVYNSSTTTITTTTTTSETTTTTTFTTTSTSTSTTPDTTTSTSTTSLFVPTTTTTTTTSPGSTVSTASTATTSLITTVGTTITTSTTTIPSTTTPVSSTTTIASTTMPAPSTTTTASTITPAPSTTTTTTAVVVTTTGAGATTTTTTTTAVVITTTVAGATTTTAVVITTTVAGATTTTAVVITTTVAGATTTTTLAPGATTTVTGGGTTVPPSGTTSSGSGGGGQSTGDTTTAASTDSSNIGVIAGGAAGGLVALAGLIGGGILLAKKLKASSSLIGDKTFTEVQDLRSSEASNSATSNSKFGPTIKKNPPRPPTTVEIKSRSYNIHVIQ